MFPLLVISAIAALGAGALPIDEELEHPFIEPKLIRMETCLSCHPEKQDAKFVHTAVRMGCENCHLVTSENSRTTIRFVAKQAELCIRCHAEKKGAVLHGPYKRGQCLVCHDAHRGAFEAQVRAEVNTLCLSCHGSDQASVKVKAATGEVLLLGNQKLSREEYHQAPKLRLDPSGTTGHPILGHPVTGKDPHGKDLNCLSCHDPHSSALSGLMPHGVETEKDLCARCHHH